MLVIFNIFDKIGVMSHFLWLKNLEVDSMTKADVIFKENIKKIMNEGVFSENARPVYQSGGQANSKYVTGAFAEYDLSKGEFPITTLRPIPIKSSIREIFWIYQDQTNDLSVLNHKYNVKYWNDWEVDGTGTIGERYGAVVKKHDIIHKILKQLEKIHGIVAMLSHFGITKLLKIQTGFCHVLSKPCMMSVVLTVIFTLMRH